MLIHSAEADAVFPYLIVVFGGQMSPEFTADQAQAAIQPVWATCENSFPFFMG